MTGSASWFFKACTEYILGIRPTLSGLLIDPCIPKTWDSFEVKRNFRGATFNIKVKNPQQVSNGVKFIKVGGKEINGNLLPDFKSGEHKVEVLMGS